MAEVLWAKGDSIDKLMQELTVGNDPILDRELVVWDCIGSAAHARMLQSVGLLTREDSSALVNELKDIYQRARRGEIQIPFHLEDVHNVIETILVDKLGDTGRRIHVGRARNDQVLVTTRLHLRDVLLRWTQAAERFSQSCFERYKELKDVEMPGYTHMQPAMPSSVGLWLQAFGEGALELVREGLALLEIVNTNPLGASAGFGSNIPLDRALTTQLLGFSRVQRSPIDCNNSRGRYEEKVVRFGADVAALFEKMACDIMLYTTREFGFFFLPVDLTTGSTIMPQKRNPDLAELLRARGAKIRAAAIEIALVTGKLTSSYNRDFQYTKEPVMRADRELKEMFKMATLLIERFQVNETRLSQSMYPDLYATYEANREARAGTPYREAYRMVARKVRQPDYNPGELVKDFGLVAQQVESQVCLARAELNGFGQELARWHKRFTEVEAAIFDV